MMMKVFAQLNQENGFEYRSNTILQFGNSSKLIGSCVLANPGSSSPIQAITSNDENRLRQFYRVYRQPEVFSNKDWYEFKPDSTMRFIEKIFNGFYIGQAKQIEGIVQLFNVINIKNQNLQEALDHHKDGSSFLRSEGIERFFNGMPIYLGFGSDIKSHSVLKNWAKEVFDNLDVKQKKIYNPNFSSNKFYHPMYLNRSYKRPHMDNFKSDVLSKIVSN